MNASKALHLSQHCLGETFQINAPCWCQQGCAGGVRATSQAVQPPSMAGHGPAGTRGWREPQNLLTLLTPRNCGFIQLFPDCPFLCPCSFQFRLLPHAPEEQGEEPGWLAEVGQEAGERVIRSGQHWTRVLGKVPLWKQNECNKLSVWH